MKKYLKAGPDGTDVCLTCQLLQTGKHRQHPRRHATDIGDIPAACLAGYQVALHLEVFEQSRTLLGYSDKIDQRVDVLYQYGAEVTHQTFFHVVVLLMATTKYQGPAVKDAALGIVVQIVSHGTSTTGIMGVMKSLAAHWYELALVVCCAR